MKKLFMVYIGGHMPTSNIEVHDVRFVIGDEIEDCYPALQSQWWGDPDTLHLDCWGAVSTVDGHDITLSDRPGENSGLGLFFVNLGGYDPATFDELHKNMLVVAQSEAFAKHKAKETVKHWQIPHKDTLFEVEKTLNLTDHVLKEQGLFLHLSPSREQRPFEFTCLYTPISQKALAKRARQ